MDTNLDNPTKLTQFAPLQPEEKQPTVGQFFSKFFKFGKNVVFNDTSSAQPSPVEGVLTENSAVDTDNQDPELQSLGSESVQIPIYEGRSYPNILKRISNLLATKRTNLQAYGDTELRQYWMPDSVSMECYECSERFTTWRRRHHCRLCGQIFCARCCSQEISGKIMGCTGGLRVCLYCCKVVYSYLSSENMESELTADLRALQEDLQIKLGTISPLGGPEIISSMSSSLGYLGDSNSILNAIGNDGDSSSFARRKISVGYQEEKFTIGRITDDIGVSEERCRAFQRSTSLRTVYEEILAITNNTGNQASAAVSSDRSLILATHRYRLRTYNQCFLGSQLVDWLINHNKATSRAQATTLGQALLEAGYLENVVDSPASSGISGTRPLFSDSPAGFYRPCMPSQLTFELPTRPSTSNNRDGAEPRPREPAEPTWVQQIPQDGGGATDSEAESHASPPIVPSGTRLPSSSSSFYLDMDWEASTVHLVRPAESVMDGILSPTNHTKSIPSHEIVSKDVLVLHNSVEHEIVPTTGWHNLKQLRDDHGEADAYLALNEAWKKHENGLLAQLLNAEGLSQSWASIIKPIVEEVVDCVRPDMNHDAEIMDICEYVRVKAVPGGDNRNESCVIRGIVCTKNVAHKCMQGRRKNPQILLLYCSLVYQRNEGKFTTLEPVLMQENTYLQNATDRILAMKPDVVLVGRNASRVAQQLLGDAGVTLATAVKVSVLERLVLASGADRVKSIDAAKLGRKSWKLATCHEFYTKQFKDDKNGSKTLMFFEGMPQSHLACTVILRGASKVELKKLKRVTQRFLFARYNWRLEHSFLMDEFARPPFPKKDVFFDGSKENSPDNKYTTENNFESRISSAVLSSKNKTDIDVNFSRKICNDDDDWNMLSSTKSPNHNKGTVPDIATSSVHGDAGSNEEVKALPLNDTIIRLGTEITSQITEKTEPTFNDPLQFYEDDVFNNSISQKLSVSEMPLCNRFRKALDDTILSISPYMTFTTPFFETEVGRRCKLRKFFPLEIYYSEQFYDKIDKNTSALKSSTEYDKNILEDKKSIKLKPYHPFIIAKLTTDANSDEVQTLLANFRACGGRLEHQPFQANRNSTIQPKEEKPTDCTCKEQSEPIDALDINNHQRLAVSFCSFNAESQNTPTFCVNPCIVNMHFYGKLDIPLGYFLMKYCFRESYICPDCGIPMLKHTRRYVHHNGCVTLRLNKVESRLSSEENRIVIWSWCFKCNTTSPVVPISVDTWSFSFAKFLEYKLHGSMYSRRGKNDNCTHSLHHDHVQYFGCNNMVASFKYMPVELWELSLPYPKIEFVYNGSLQRQAIIEEIKKLSLKGHEIYSTILDKIMALPGDTNDAGLIQQLNKDQAIFKTKIDEVQLKLTSPTLESIKLEHRKPTPDIQQALRDLEDSVVHVKRMIAETCEVWNIRFSDEQGRLAKHPSVIKQNSKTFSEPPSARKLNVNIVLGDESGGADTDLPSSPDYNAVDVANATNLGIYDFNKDICNKKTIPESIINNDNSNKVPQTDETNKIITKKIRSLDQDEVSDECPANIPDSPKGHTRSQSEGTTAQNTDTQLDMRKDMYVQPDKDKRNVKARITQYLTFSADACVIPMPFNAEEHHLLPIEQMVPLSVYEKEPSSIIAYALTTSDYRRNLEELCGGKASRSSGIIKQTAESPSPIHRRKIASSTERIDSSNDLNVSTDSRHSGILSFLRPNSGSADTSDVEDCTVSPPFDNTSGSKGDTTVTDKPKPQTNNLCPHIDIQYHDNRAKFLCRVHWAEQFATLRRAVLAPDNVANSTKSLVDFEEWEERYIRSLYRSVPWTAVGGKSGSFFCKTKDERFILKEMSRNEMDKFLEFAPNYFEYMHKCLATSQPTLLGKIIGVYRVCYRTAKASDKKNFLVMENLFYERTVTQKFDLKGSMRNRLVNADSQQDSEIVLLDENLMKMTCKSPLYILPHSKAVLSMAIKSDAEFLAAQYVMDYSLLVGLDSDTKELVVGIIDYIRKFTWDKRIETIVKSFGSQGKSPTVVSPNDYRNRFIAAMNRYFLPVPGRWSGLGVQLD